MILGLERLKKYDRRLANMVEALPRAMYFDEVGKSSAIVMLYSDSIPAIKTPALEPRRSGSVRPAFSAASKVHSSRSRCWGSIERASSALILKKDGSKACISPGRK